MEIRFDPEKNCVKLKIVLDVWDGPKSTEILINIKLLRRFFCVVNWARSFNFQIDSSKYLTEYSQKYIIFGIAVSQKKQNGFNISYSFMLVIFETI